MEKVLKWIYIKLKISLDPSQSRWGITSFLYSTSLFFIALFPSFYAIYLSLVEVKIVIPILNIDVSSALSVVSFALLFVCLGSGIIILLFTIFLSIHLLRNQNMEEPVSKEVKKLNDNVKEGFQLINQTLSEIRAELTNKH